MSFDFEKDVTDPESRKGSLSLPVKHFYVKSHEHPTSCIDQETNDASCFSRI